MVAVVDVFAAVDVVVVIFVVVAATADVVAVVDAVSAAVDVVLFYCLCSLDISAVINVNYFVVVFVVAIVNICCYYCYGRCCF